MNGVDGISQKGARPGNASHYYSLTRMPTRGTLVVDGERFEVTGDSWMDHEFGTSFLEPEQQGWDWLSIQLDDSRELMLYQLRRVRRHPRSAVERHDRRRPGRTTHLAATDFTMTPPAARYTAPSGAALSAGMDDGDPVASRSRSTPRPPLDSRNWPRSAPASPTGKG